MAQRFRVCDLCHLPVSGQGLAYPNNTPGYIYRHILCPTKEDQTVKNPIPLNELLGHLGQPQAKETYPRIDRYPQAGMDINTSSSEMKAGMDGGPQIYHISFLIPMHEVRAWTDQGYVSFEKDIVAHSIDDAIRQLSIHVNRK